MLSITDAGARVMAAAAALAAMDRTLARQLQDQARDQVLPDVIAAARRRAPTRLAAKVAGTGRWSPYAGTPGVRFGGTRAVTADGTPGRALARGTEYGSSGRWRTRYTGHTPRGRAYPVTRRTTRGFMPRRDGGAWLTPAMTDVAPDVVTAWTELVEAATVAALNGGR